jgi:hypothetical protein
MWTATTRAKHVRDGFCLVGGFHPAERHGCQMVRETDGCGCLQLKASNLDRSLMVEVGALALDVAVAA